MGLLALHSAHYSKVFQRLLGTSCSLRWRNDGERELVWTVDPAHPIAAGVPHPIVIDAHEMYGEHFDIPAPDELVFVSSFAGGEVFRGGCCFRRGAGRIFYFSPGDQDYPIYHHPDVQRVIANAVAVGGAAAGRPARRARQSRVAARVVRAGERVTAPRTTSCASASSASGGPASSTSPPTTRSRARRSWRSPGWRIRSARKLAAQLRDRASASPAGRTCSISTASTRSASRCRPSCTPRSRSPRCSAASTSCREKPIALNGREADAMVQAARNGRPRARRRLQPPPARRHPEAQGRPSTPAASDARTTRRPGGCAAPGSRRSAAGSRGPSWPAAGRSSTSACTCSTTRCSCSATPRSTPSARRPTTCSPARASGRAPRSEQDGRDRREDVRRRGPGLGLHAPGRRRHAARRGELGRAPPRRRRVRHHALRHRRRRRADRRRLRARGLAADLHRRRRRGRRDDACP